MRLSFGGSFLHRFFGLIFMAVLLARGVVFPFPAFARSKLQIEKLEEIRQEISLLNLFRGLYLSKDQASRLWVLAEKAHTIRESVEKAFLADEKSILDAFGTLRDALYLEPGLEKAAQEKAKTLDERIKEAMGKTQDQIADLEREAGNILTSSQLAIIDDFRPCLIPPKDLRNPVRVGQAAADGGQLGKIADLIHATPDDVWAARKGHLFAKFVQRLEAEVGAMTPEMRSDLMNRLETESGKIRSCQDVDYTLKRELLASNLLFIDPRKTMKHGHRKVGEVGRWLLSETSYEALPKWIKSMEKTPNPVAGTDDDESPIEQTITEVGAKAATLINRLYKQRKDCKDLPSLQQLNGPVKDAVEKNDRVLLLDKTLSAIDRLVAVRTDQGTVKALAQVARQISHLAGLPILNPQHDPYGFAEELKGYVESGNPQDACKKIRALIDTIRKFKQKS